MKQIVDTRTPEEKELDRIRYDRYLSGEATPWDILPPLWNDPYPTN